MMIWLLCALTALADDHAIVISAKGQELEMSKREVKQMFTRQTLTWNDEQRLTIVLPLIESPAMLWLSRNILGLPPEVYHRYLLEKAYRAGEDPPMFVATPTLIKGEMVLTVAQKDDLSSEEYSIIHIR
jgi:hypothetical protein